MVEKQPPPPPPPLPTEQIADTAGESLEGGGGSTVLSVGEAPVPGMTGTAGMSSDNLRMSSCFRTVVTGDKGRKLAPVSPRRQDEVPLVSSV